MTKIYLILIFFFYEVPTIVIMALLMIILLPIHTFRTYGKTISWLSKSRLKGHNYFISKILFR